MKHSDTIAKLSKALVAANAKVEHATKDSTNPHFKSGFASLNSVLDTIKPVYADFDLTIVQMPGFEDGHATLHTRILHESGEWLEGVSGSPLQKNDPQGIGSAVSYLRRYSLAAIAGIGQTDDDGNAASQPRAASKPKAAGPEIHCPKCGSGMYDNRLTRTGKQPDLKCRAKECDTPIWLDSFESDLLQAISEALDLNMIDEKERAQMDKAVIAGDPAMMFRVNKKLDELVAK